MSEKTGKPLTLAEWLTDVLPTTQAEEVEIGVALSTLGDLSNDSGRLSPTIIAGGPATQRLRATLALRALVKGDEERLRYWMGELAPVTVKLGIASYTANSTPPAQPAMFSKGMWDGIPTGVGATPGEALADLLSQWIAEWTRELSKKRIQRAVDAGTMAALTLVNGNWKSRDRDGDQ